MCLSSRNRNIRLRVCGRREERRRNRYETRFSNDAGILAIDLAKTGFQVRATASNGGALYNRNFSRPKFEKFPEARSPCPVGTEACSTSCHRGRIDRAAGREVRLINPSCASRSRARENDAADAEAIAAAVRQSGMRFMEPKSLDRQSAAILLEARQKFVPARARMMNSMRGMLSEIGHIAPRGGKALRDLVDKFADDPAGIPLDAGSASSPAAR